MCADSTPADRPGRVQLTGRVEMRRLAPGSHSERTTAVLVCGDGRWHALRRVGGHPLRDAALDALVGRELTLTGRLRENFFLIDGVPE